MVALTYLDYNAGAPLRDEVKDWLVPYISSSSIQEVANPSSLHRFGQATRRLIETARGELASCFEVKEDQVIFTSSGSESNNLALLSAQDAPILIAGNAHDSLLYGLKQTNAHCLKVTPLGQIDKEHLKESLALLNPNRNAPALISLLWAHNETGIIEDIEGIAKVISPFAATIHIDGVQGVGRLSLSPILALAKQGLISSFTLSGHKLGAFSGIGALIVFQKNRLIPMIKGGGQERNLRAGTENTIGILSLQLALKQSQLKMKDENIRLLALNQKLENGIKTINPKVIIIGEKQNRITNTSQFITIGKSSNHQLIFMDLAGIMVSAGSACSSGKIGAGTSLLAQGFAPELASCAIRLSLGWKSSENDIELFLKTYQSMLSR